MFNMNGYNGAGEIAHWEKCLLLKHEGLSVDPQNAEHLCRKVDSAKAIRLVEQ